MELLVEGVGAGGLGAVVVAAVAVGALSALAVVAAIRASGGRPAEPWWWLGPSVVAAVGLVGSGVRLGDVGADVHRPEAGEASLALATVFVDAFEPFGVAAAVLVVLCAATGLAVGLSVFRTRGPDGSYGTPRRPPVVATLGVVIVGVLMVAGPGSSTNWWGLGVAAALVVGTVGCLLANFGAATEDRAVDRYLAAVGLVGATVSATVAAVWSPLRRTIHGASQTSPDEQREILEQGAGLVEQGFQIGVVGTFAALIVAALLVAESREAAVSGRVLRRVGTALAPGLLVAAALVFAGARLQQAPFVSALYELMGTVR